MLLSARRLICGALPIKILSSGLCKDAYFYQGLRPFSLIGPRPLNPSIINHKTPLTAVAVAIPASLLAALNIYALAGRLIRRITGERWSSVTSVYLIPDLMWV